MLIFHKIVKYQFRDDFVSFTAKNSLSKNDYTSLFGKHILDFGHDCRAEQFVGILHVLCFYTPLRFFYNFFLQIGSF